MDWIANIYTPIACLYCGRQPDKKRHIYSNWHIPLRGTMHEGKGMPCQFEGKSNQTPILRSAWGRNVPLDSSFMSTWFASDASTLSISQMSIDILKSMLVRSLPTSLLQVFDLPASFLNTYDKHACCKPMINRL